MTARAALDALAVYLRPRLLLILALGFASGLPLLLTSSTLSIRLREAGVDLTAIGAFSLVGIPYSLKFLWAPLLDRLPFPVLTRRLGRRRGWMLAIHIALIAAVAGLGLIPPEGSVLLIALVAILVAFLSATQDIAIDAYRVEVLKEEEFGAGAAMAVYGFRVGMLMATVGTLYLAEWIDWEAAYAITAATLLIGVAAILAAPEPERPPGDLATPQTATELFGAAYWAPLKEFAGRDGWLALLLFVLFFKFGDALLSQMAGALYVDLGFSKSTIAEVGKLYGFVAVMVGTFLGGVAVAYWGLGRSLVVAGVLQAISNVAYWRLAVVGDDVATLAWVVGFENFATGLGQTAFVAFLMQLCDRRFTAAQFALLTSIVAFSPKVMVAPAGALADALGWADFCLATAFAALPGLLLLCQLLYRYPETWRAAPQKED